MAMKHLLALCATCVALSASPADPFDKAIDTPPHTSSLSAVRALMREKQPRLQFSADMPADSMTAWQQHMSEAMARLMRHPDVTTPQPTLVSSTPREGYTVERWLTYPLPDAVVPVFVLVPDGVSATNPARGAALCIPGFGGTKELLAGEAPGNYDLSAPRPDGPAPKQAMARQFAEQGLVAVAVDNVSAGELSDNGHFDYLNTSRHLLELGWSYLGLCSWQDKVVLDWLKTRPDVPADRIIVSGFSLGTEPMMALGLLDPDIYAFVYNDFLCRTRERILAMTAPDAQGRRQFPNNIEHLIPEFLTEFDFPDIVAALAPRPVICTEGGLDRDFAIIKSAYAKAGAPDAFEYRHYEMYAPDSCRMEVDVVPAGIDRDTFFRICNVDPPHHYFKTEHVIPWLNKILPPQK